ncbi:MAG: hypothetical protein N2596_03320, partial [Syntrophorhabdaceae bacterium]|nr:hypothetical protein [Syntrophorhabdaceae bacterium]
HDNGVIHGDISPRNIIVSNKDVILTDYDFVTKIGESLSAPATPNYSSTSYEDKLQASPSDDIYALAASFFHVVFGQEPFSYGGILNKKKGLNWEGIEKEKYAKLSHFLDKATHPNYEERFLNISQALAFLDKSLEKDMEEDKTTIEIHKPEPEPSEGRVEWLLSILKSYPGSLYGNQETRGLDTDFASKTYVPTELENRLYRDIMEHKVSLVILCGNAGDGKTALLQHLAERLGLGRVKSAQRIIEGVMSDGTKVKINLDGSASWQNLSSDEILDEFLKPFHEGSPSENMIHLLAINDGRLLEWVENFKDRNGRETRLTDALYNFLQEEAFEGESYIRFISLNQRSLVGSLDLEKKQINSVFFNRLIDHLYGDVDANTIWAQCKMCTAKKRCEVFQTGRVFGPAGFPELKDESIRKRARERLLELFQAVHVRGETHITVREMRAALVYILFGLHHCIDYHNGSVNQPLPYWDKAFSSESLNRQGELLKEMTLFDPALDSHPKIDRHLTSRYSDDENMPPSYPELTLASARRRAYFEWTDEDIEKVGDETDALGLTRGKYLKLFMQIPFMNETELEDVCKRICSGISRLEDLPQKALNRKGIVPLRITPRTPTETSFWIEKPLDAFKIKADLPSDFKDSENLHRQIFLIYTYRKGDEEILKISAELFNLLLELSEGYQIGDIATDDTFAHLSIFVQRLVREDEREMLAWNPMEEDKIYKIYPQIKETENGLKQVIKIEHI